MSVVSINQSRKVLERARHSVKDCTTTASDVVHAEQTENTYTLTCRTTMPILSCSKRSHALTSFVNSAVG